MTDMKTSTSTSRAYGLTIAIVVFVAACATMMRVASAQAPTGRGQQPSASPQTPDGRGRGRGAEGRGATPRLRKVVLAWADTRNGIAQHDSVSHALAVIERLGYESGLYDTFIRTDSNIISKRPQMTNGQPASGGP